MNDPYDGVDIDKFYECLCLYFYPVGSLPFLVDELDQSSIYNFFRSFERTSLSQNLIFSLTFFFFFNCYLAIPQPILGHSQGDSLTSLMLITAFVQVRPKGHQEPCNEVGSLSSTECLVGFEPGTFRF